MTSPCADLRVLDFSSGFAGALVTMILDYPGHADLVAAKAGRMMTLSGQLRREGPVYSALPLARFGAAQHALHGILAALHARPRLGAGQHVRTSLLRGLIPYDHGQWLSIQQPPVANPK